MATQKQRLQDDIKKVGADTTRLSPLDGRTIILRRRELIDGALGRRARRVLSRQASYAANIAHVPGNSELPGTSVTTLCIRQVRMPRGTRPKAGILSSAMPPDGVMRVVHEAYGHFMSSGGRSEVA